MSLSMDKHWEHWCNKKKVGLYNLITLGCMGVANKVAGECMLGEKTWLGLFFFAFCPWGREKERSNFT